MSTNPSSLTPLCPVPHRAQALRHRRCVFAETRGPGEGSCFQAQGAMEETQDKPPSGCHDTHDNHDMLRNPTPCCRAPARSMLPASRAWGPCQTIRLGQAHSEPSLQRLLKPGDRPRSAGASLFSAKDLSEDLSQKPPTSDAPLRPGNAQRRKCGSTYALVTSSTARSPARSVLAPSSDARSP